MEGHHRLRRRSGDDRRSAHPRRRGLGAVSLYREPGQPFFDQDELAFVKNVAPHLAEGARRALLVGEATDPDRADGPGLVIVTGDWHVESATAGVDRWLADLPDGNWEAGKLPTSIVAVA